MRTASIALSSAFASLILVNGAQAQNSQASQINQLVQSALATAGIGASSSTPTPCYVRDANNKILATAVPSLQQELLLSIGGNCYSVEYDSAGLTPNVVFFYTTPYCTGQPYIMTGVYQGGQFREWLPQEAQWDGSKLWGPTGPVGLIQANSETFGMPVACSNQFIGNNGPVIVARAAGVLSMPTFAAPFTVK